MSLFYIGGKQEQRPCQGRTLVSGRVVVGIQAVWFQCLCSTKQIVRQYEKCYSRAKSRMRKEQAMNVPWNHRGDAMWKVWKGE